MKTRPELFTENSSRRKDRLTNAVIEARTTGFAEIGSLLLGKTLETLRHEANRVPKCLQRDIKPWFGVHRSTFVPLSRRVLTSSDVKYAAFSSRLWTPAAHRVANMLAGDIRLVGKSLDSKPLSEWSPNRIGFNYMRGSVSTPAVIPEHVDVPEEKGVVLAIDLADGATHIILSYDACGEAGIDQAPHEVIAHNNRLSMTIAELRA